MKQQRELTRQCIVSGEPLPKAALLRFVVGPEQRLVPDVGGKLPGRGIWVYCRRDAVQEAVNRKLFARSAKQSVTVDDGLVEKVEALLYQRLLDSLAMMRKAGLAIHGFEKVAQAVATNQVAALLHAQDASEDGKRKLRAPDRLAICDMVRREDLSRVMGVENAVHVAILNGRGKAHFLENLRRFTGFMQISSL